jgi:hypothetical protein
VDEVRYHRLNEEMGGIELVTWAELGAVLVGRLEHQVDCQAVTAGSALEVPLVLVLVLVQS